MDREHFDALTRLFSAHGSRRAAVGAALGSVLLGYKPAPLVAGRKCHCGAKRRRRKRKGGAGGACIPLENLCAPLTNPCCPNTECVKLIPSKFVFVGTCQSRSCTSNQECAARFPGQDVVCVQDPSKCSGIRGSCCLPQQCIFNDDCAHSGVCCLFFGESHCCAPGQRCTITGCLS